MNSPWLIRYRRNPAASIRLFCFHCAGGSASEFRGWPAHLHGRMELVAVQLPGREARVRDAFIASIDDLISGVVQAITPLLDKPYVVFGHSFGAVGGFEVIRELRRRRLNQPFLFIPAGRQGPHVKDKDPPIASLPKEEFIEELRKDYGDHIGHVLASDELREVFIPQIHADFALSESYRFRAEQPLDCPIVAFAGVSEKDLETEELNAWSAHTNQSFHSRRFPGDHFFIRESQALVIEAINQEVASVRRERTARSHLLA
jgi:medium-chain acyl-[acyl-carrier-protein] hydrolase